MNTTFVIIERGGWWFPVVTHGNRRGVALQAHVGILEAARAVQYRWPAARLVGIR